MIKKEIEIRTDIIKLDQFLKFAGFAETGGHAKEIVAEGAVFVNGACCMQRGRKLKKGDIIRLDEFEIKIV